MVFLFLSLWFCSVKYFFLFFFLFFFFFYCRVENQVSDRLCTGRYATAFSRFLFPLQRKLTFISWHLNSSSAIFYFISFIVESIESIFVLIIYFSCSILPDCQEVTGSSHSLIDTFFFFFLKSWHLCFWDSTSAFCFVYRTLLMSFSGTKTALVTNKKHVVFITTSSVTTL